MDPRKFMQEFADNSELIARYREVYAQGYRAGLIQHPDWYDPDSYIMGCFPFGEEYTRDFMVIANDNLVPAHVSDDNIIYMLNEWYIDEPKPIRFQAHHCCNWEFRLDAFLNKLHGKPRDSYPPYFQYCKAWDATEKESFKFLEFNKLLMNKAPF